MDESNSTIDEQTYLSERKRILDDERYSPRLKTWLIGQLDAMRYPDVFQAALDSFAQVRKDND